MKLNLPNSAMTAHLFVLYLTFLQVFTMARLVSVALEFYIPYYITQARNDFCCFRSAIGLHSCMPPPTGLWTWPLTPKLKRSSLSKNASKLKVWWNTVH